MPPALLLTGAVPVAAALAYCYLAARAALFLAIISFVGLAAYRACLTPAARREFGTAPVVAACAMPPVAWLSPTILLVYAAMLALVPMLARSRRDVAPLYLFALLLLPGLDWTVTFGPLKLFEFGVHDALAVGATIALWRGGALRGRGPSRLDLPVLALLALLVVATARGTSVTNALRVTVNTVLDCGLPYLIASRGVRGADDLRRAMVALGGAAVVLAAVLVYEMWSAWPIYNALYAYYRIPVLLLVKLRGGFLRAGGPFLESTSIAMVMTFCFVATAMARDAFRSRRHHLATLAVILAGLVPPQSRGAWIGAVIGMVVIDLYRGRGRALAVRAAAIGGAGALLLAVAQASPTLSESIGLSGGGASDTVDYRHRLLERGMQEFGHSPITGFSMPEITARLSDLRQGEGIIDFVNTYIYFALIGGAVGLSVFVGTFAFHLVAMWRGRRAWRRLGGEGPAAFVFAVLLIPLEMLFFTSLGGRVQIFLFVFFGVAAAMAQALRDQAISGRTSRSAASPTGAPTAAAATSAASSRTSSSPTRHRHTQV